MLTALISLMHDGDKGLSRRGDVLILKLGDAPWADFERRYHQLVEWSDAEIETDLLARRAAGERWPSVALPYAEFNQEKTRRVLTVRSRQYVDFTSIDATKRSQVLSTSIEAPKLLATEYTRRTR